MSQQVPFVLTKPPHYSEFSGLRSRKDSDSPQRAWRKSRQQSSATNSHAEAVQSLQRQINALRKRAYVSEDFETVRLLLCDPCTGASSYYLVSAKLDPDQTPGLGCE